MQATEIFAGPILRLARPDLVTIWLATTRPQALTSAVRTAGSTDWLPSGCSQDAIEVFPQLHVHLLRIRPTTDLPADTLLEYAIGDATGFADFEALVAADGLAYPGFTLPTFYLQGEGRPLVVLYGSCRKPHDTKGGTDDALAYGDDVIAAAPTDLASRPTILCALGDQIYADDVHDVTFDQVQVVGEKLGGPAEELPGGAPLPEGGRRQQFLREHAGFTSDEADNHLASLADYVAMYGLAFNRANWPERVREKAVAGTLEGLPKVRRLLANTPTYMAFDDHDITDDWNLDLRWQDAVYTKPLGRRIVANALCAFFLFQGWGSQPERFDPDLPTLAAAIAGRHTSPAGYEDHVLGLQDWEFATPTRPLIYFLDTRTQRGTRNGRPNGKRGAPAFLKSPDAWQTSFDRISRLTAEQGPGYPIVLATTAPVFGFERVEIAQRALAAFAGPYRVDLEGWAANPDHLLHFARLWGESEIVLLSGDVHHGYTETARFDTFGEPGAPPRSARFLQLTSSAMRNFAKGVMRIAAEADSVSGWFVNRSGNRRRGWYQSPDFIIESREHRRDSRHSMMRSTLADARPGSGFVMRFNNSFHTGYLAEHNLGLATFDGRAVRNVFLTAAGRIGERCWDFADDAPWQAPPPSS